MNFLLLTSIEFKKIRHSKILLILAAATIILWLPSIFNASINFNMQAEGISPENNFFYPRLYGNVMVYVPCKHGSWNSPFKPDRKDKQRNFKNACFTS